MGTVLAPFRQAPAIVQGLGVGLVAGASTDRHRARTRVTIGARCRRLDLNHPFLPRYSRPPRLHCSPSLMLPPTPHGSGTLHRAAHADLQRNFSLCIRIVWMSLLAVIAYCVCLRHAFVPDAYHLFSPSLLWVDCRPCL